MAYNSTVLHVTSDMEEWLQIIDYEKLEIVTIQVPNLPVFDFPTKMNAAQTGSTGNTNNRALVPSKSSYKVNSTGTTTIQYVVFPSAFKKLKEIRNFIKTNNIYYEPTSDVVKNIFEHQDRTQEQNDYSTTSGQIVYRIPQNEEIARLIFTEFFDNKGTLEMKSASEVIYYYLSVLICANHEVINQALSAVKNSIGYIKFRESTFIPEHITCIPKFDHIAYYSPYLELIHFLGLIVPPVHDNDGTEETMRKVQIRNEEQFKILSDTLGTIYYEPTIRGSGWEKIVSFFKENPMFCRKMVEIVLKPPALEISLSIIEMQVLRQLRELWFKELLLLGKLNDFQECHLFAMKQDTDAHRISKVAEQCQQIKTLYKQFLGVEKVVELTLPATTRMSNDESTFYGIFDMKYSFPDLFYAAKSRQQNAKERTVKWEKFFVTLPHTVPVREINEKLKINYVTSDGNENQAIKQKSNN